MLLLDLVLCCLSSTARSGFIPTNGSIIAIGAVLLVFKYKFTISLFLFFVLPLIPVIRVFSDFILAMISWLHLAAVGQRQRHPPHHLLPEERRGG